MAGQAMRRATAWRLLMAAVAGLMALCAVVAPAHAAPGVGVRLGPWALVLPYGYDKRTDLGNLAYRKELDGSLHTAVLEVIVIREMRWNDRTRFPEGISPEQAIRHALEMSAERYMKGMRGESGELDGRFRGITVEKAEARVLPGHNICAANRWRMVDEGVEPHAGEPFVMHGYDLLCFDYVTGGQIVGMIGLRLSERFCETLGHTPIADFAAYAADIFRTLRYRPEKQDTATAGADGIADLARIEVSPATSPAALLDTMACPVR